MLQHAAYAWNSSSKVGVVNCVVNSAIVSGIPDDAIYKQT